MLTSGDGTLTLELGAGREVLTGLQATGSLPTDLRIPDLRIGRRRRPRPGSLLEAALGRPLAPQRGADTLLEATALATAQQAGGALDVLALALPSWRGLRGAGGVFAPERLRPGAISLALGGAATLVLLADLLLRFARRPRGGRLAGSDPLTLAVIADNAWPAW